MTIQEGIIRIYGENYCELDVPTFLRNEEEENMLAAQDQDMDEARQEEERECQLREEERRLA